LPKERRLAGYFLAEGKRSVDQLLTFCRSSISELLCIEETASLYGDTGIAVRVLSAQNMKSICTSRTPQGIAALVQIPSYVYTSDIPEKKGDKIILLEDVQDPGNIGSLIRTAAALGYNGVIMSDKCADPFSPKVVQSTAGSLLSVWIRRSGNYLEMADQLKKEGYELICADLRGDEPLDFKDTKSHILALGSEGAGISQKLIDTGSRTVRIPVTESGAESLNVAAAGAILMFMCSRSPESRQGLRAKG